jgi:hypothetical protein
MALERRKPQQDELFIPAGKIVTGPGHPFHARLHTALADAGFGDFAGHLCPRCYNTGGRPGIHLWSFRPQNFQPCLLP